MPPQLLLLRLHRCGRKAGATQPRGGGGEGNAPALRPGCARFLVHRCPVHPGTPLHRGRQGTAAGDQGRGAHRHPLGRLHPCRQPGSRAGTADGGDRHELFRDRHHLGLSGARAQDAHGLQPAHRSGELPDAGRCRFPGSRLSELLLQRDRRTTRDHPPDRGVSP